VAKVIVVNAARCYACLSCVVECAYHRAKAGDDIPLTSGVLGEAACDVVGVGTQPIPLVCQHCEDAPCLTVCPSGAISRDPETDAVVLNAELCIGCRACVMACPFGMIRLRPGGKGMVKCDLCIDRTRQGELPACVVACPSGALELKEVDEVVTEARRRASLALHRAEGED